VFLFRPLPWEYGVRNLFRHPGPDDAAVAYVSPELYLGIRIITGDDDRATLGLVRGVTPAALLVRRQFQLLEGHWPRSGEVLVERLAATKLGRGAAALVPGRRVTYEGRTWTISGQFGCAGSALESELWCPLEDLQQAMKRQDLSLVAITLASCADFADVDEFCKERLDLELQATRERPITRRSRSTTGPRGCVGRGRRRGLCAACCWPRGWC